MKRMIKAAVCLAVTGLLVANNGLDSLVVVQAAYDKYGYDESGYDVNGYNRDGYDRDGYGRDGCDVNGYDKRGYDRNGYDRDGYDINGYNRDGYNREGYGRDGYDRDGYDREGYGRDGYDRDGYNREGYGLDGYNKDGYDKNGYDREGYSREGYNREGYDRNGYPWNPQTPTGDLYDIIKCPDKSWTYEVDYVDDGSIGYTTGYHIICNTVKPKQVLAQINANIKKAKKLDYEVQSIDPVATKKGYGQYKITIKYNKEYKDAVMSVNMTIFPYIKTRCTLTSVNGKKRLIEVLTTKDGAKSMDGVEYALSQATAKKLVIDYDTGAPTPALKEKLTKKGSKKVNTLKFEPLTDSKKYIAADLAWSPKLNAGKKRLVFHNRARFYIVVNGKKIYSQYKDYYSYSQTMTVTLR